MKTFVIEYKAPSFKETGFIKIKNQQQAILWFAANSPAKSKILKITETSDKSIKDDLRRRFLK